MSCRPASLLLFMAPCVALLVSAHAGADHERNQIPSLTVELVDAGQEPRAALRLSAAPKDVDEAVLTRHATVLVSRGSEQRDRSLPLARMLVDAHLEETLASGDRRYDVRVGALPTTRSSAADLLLHGSLTVTPRGIPVRFDPAPDGMPRHTLTGPIGVVDVMAQRPRTSVPVDEDGALALSSQLVPFPEEAVGVGARWRATMIVRELGVVSTRVTTYELVALEAGGARLRAHSEDQALGKGPFDWQNVSFHLRDFQSSTDTELRVSFDGLLPRIDQHADLRMNVAFDDEDASIMPITMTRQLTQSLAPPGPEELFPFALDAVSSASDTWWYGLALCRGLRGDRSGPYVNRSLSGECQAGLPVGTWIARDEHGTKRIEGSFQLGLPHGTWQTFGADGKRRGIFKMKSGTGTAVAWWPNGKKRVQVAFRDGKPDGAFASWYASGKKQLEGRFAAGDKRGPWTGWSESGQLAERWRFDPGCRLITAVVPDHPAAQAGVLPGDVVLELGGLPLAAGDEIRELVRRAGARAVALVVERDGKPKKLSVTPQLDKGELRIGVSLGCRLELK